MVLPYSLDEVVRTSDEAAVRMHFDERTTAALRLLSIVFLVVSIPFFLASMAHGEALRMYLAAIMFITAGALVRGLRKKAKPAVTEFIRTRIRGIALTFALTQSACLLLLNAPSDGVVGLAVMLPLTFVAFRLLAAEHVLLHALYAGVSTSSILFFVISRESTAELTIPPLMLNAGAMMLALMMSRRARRNVTAQWTERRLSAREQIRMRDELRYARELQLSMLPEFAPSLSWADLSAVSVPATEVGGDYYDYFVDGERVALVCGDVAGHGMASGIVLASMRSGFTLLRDSLSNPAVVLRRLHDLIAETSRRRMLVTVAVVLLDHANRRATIASAGHPPVIVAHADGTIDMLNLYAPPLGVRLPVTIPQHHLDLRAGDVFVLHSDGIYETISAAGEDYGLDRMMAVVSEHGGGTAEALRDAILAEVTAFRGSSEAADDITIVAARVV